MCQVTIVGCDLHDRNLLLSLAVGKNEPQDKPFRNDAEGRSAMIELSIDEIEEAMVELGDAVAREYARLQLARQMEQAPEHPPCPDCRHPGEPAGQRDREILTRRGPVPIREAKYRCPKCRRHFFPSDRAVGT
jgi:hypothetical protein